ncbi:MAG: phospholipase D-like domain-containing protein [Pseudomonadota bacterium]
MISPLGEVALAPLSDREYYPIVLAAAERAQMRIWASVFICDIRPSRDVSGRVLDLVATLSRRAALGVDVRFMVTGDASAADIAAANLATGLYLHHSGVPLRRTFRDEQGRLGSHAKMVVIDNTAFIGSQNWTDGGFGAHIEDAICVEGKGVERVAAEFLYLWSNGKGVPRALK